MKNKQRILPKILLLFGIFFLIPNQSEAQLLKKLKQKAKNKIEREAEKRAERRINKKIDKEFDKAEDVLDGKKKKNTNEKKSQNPIKEGTPIQDKDQIKKPNVVWSKFDFIPGDTVIFEDSPSADEENGEFPSRWDLVKGQVEIANVDGENVIMLIDGAPAIIPYIKDSKEDYLPEIFTIEFDFYRPANSNRFSVYLSDLKNQKYEQEIEINFARVTVDDEGVTGINPDKNNSSWNEKSHWTHVSIAYTKGKLKVYLDDTRVINIPRYQKNPTGLTLQAYWADMSDDKAFYVKNVRIAKGGVKYYDRVLSEGKIIVNGIKFDTNKATLKPESMGPINKIYELMQKNIDINFSVEGHTDSDGNEAHNQKLSEARGEAVMNKLMELGIASNRLKSTGFGESKPIDNNSTPEGKANNRRVEFVKFTGTTSTSVNNSNESSKFNELDKKTIAIKLETLPESINIPISNNSGILSNKGTVIVFATSDGNLGKMEILNVDKNDNYKLTVKYVTYNYNGSVHSQSDHLEIPGTYTCDLDQGKTEDVIHSEIDIRLGIQDSKTATLYSGETAIIKAYK
jgi:outer membrane protein OmpA-like peptidoglycan-associated protein